MHAAALACACRGDCGLGPDISGAYQAGDGLPLPTGAEKMSQNDARAFAFSLALSLMVTILVFKAGDGSVGVMQASEYDGEESAIICDYDPYEIM